MTGLTLIVVADDVGGSMNALARDLRRQGHNARVLSFAPELSLGFPIDLYQGVDGGRELLSVAGQAEHLHLVDCSFDMLGPWASPLRAKIEVGRVSLSLQMDGGLSVAHYKQELRAWKAQSTHCVATRPGLACTLGVEFLPPYIPVQQANYRPLVTGTRQRENKNRNARFFFSAQHPLSNYPQVESLLDAWEAQDGKDVEVLTGAHHREVLRKRRRAHLTVSTGSDYYSRSCLEAWAAGLRVVALSQDPTWVQAYEALAGGPSPALDKASFEQALSQVDAHQVPDLDAHRWAHQLLDPRRWWTRFARGSAVARAS